MRRRIRIRIRVKIRIGIGPVSRRYVRIRVSSSPNPNPNSPSRGYLLVTTAAGPARMNSEWPNPERYTKFSICKQEIFPDRSPWQRTRKILFLGTKTLTDVQNVANIPGYIFILVLCQHLGKFSQYIPVWIRSGLMWWTPKVYSFYIWTDCSFVLGFKSIATPCQN